MGDVAVPLEGADPDDLAWLGEVCRPVVERFTGAGFEIFLVGGIVRDLAVGREVGRSDLDFTTDARPADTVALLDGWADAVWRQGERFGTIGARRGDHDLEITTFRADAYDPGSRKPIVSFGDHIDDDLARRDFTVNAMALSLPGMDLVDPYGGLDDIRARVLRTPLAAEVSFSDDPLRMLRAARFAAGYDLRPDPELVSAATSMAGRLGIVSVERTRDELVKLFALADPTAGLELLVRTGLAAHCLPELDAAADIDRGAALAALRQARADLLVRLVVLLVALDPRDGAGARVGERLVALRSPSADVARGRRLADAAVAVLALGVPGGGGERGPADRDRIRRGVLLRVGDDLDALTAVLSALGAGEGAAELRVLAEAEPDLVAGTSVLDGAAVMQRYGLPPGPEVGRALRVVAEARLAEGPLSRARAFAILDEALGRGRPGSPDAG